MTKLAYIQAVYSNGYIDGIKLEIDKPEIEHKLRNLKAGFITTFDSPMPGDFNPVPGDTIVESTKTFYPANIGLLKVTIVESDTIDI